MFSFLGLPDSSATPERNSAYQLSCLRREASWPEQELAGGHPESLEANLLAEFSTAKSRLGLRSHRPQGQGQGQGNCKRQVAPNLKQPHFVTSGDRCSANGNQGTWQAVNTAASEYAQRTRRRGTREQRRRRRVHGESLCGGIDNSPSDGQCGHAHELACADGSSSLSPADPVGAMPISYPLNGKGACMRADHEVAGPPSDQANSTPSCTWMEDGPNAENSVELYTCRPPQ